MKNKRFVNGNLPVNADEALKKMKKFTKVNQDYSHAGYGAYKPLPNVRKFRVEISN